MFLLTVVQNFYGELEWCLWGFGFDLRFRKNRLQPCADPQINMHLTSFFSDNNNTRN